MVDAHTATTQILWLCIALYVLLRQLTTQVTDQLRCLSLTCDAISLPAGNVLSHNILAAGTVTTPHAANVMTPCEPHAMMTCR